MADDPQGGGLPQRPERIPPMQRLLDDPFLLLFLGVAIPTVLYLAWGVMEVASVPIAKRPGPGESDMAVTSPERWIWWNEPIEKVELVWIFIALLWGLFIFFFMIAWHFIGQQNLSSEAYRIEPATYVQKVEDFATRHTVREEEGVPVVRPPAGTDVYLLARLWQWWPILELERGQSYRIHLSSADWQHGFSLQPTNINIQVHPGYEHVLMLTPTESGEFGIICNEFCGIGHHTMTGRIHVVEPQRQAGAAGAARGR